MNNELLWIWFAECFPYGSIKPLQILEETSLEDFYFDREHCAEHHHFITKTDYNRIMAHKKEDYIFMTQECGSKRINILTWDDKNYPLRLKSIDSPPMVLYYWGDLSCLSAELCIAVVGTRDCTLYSKNVTHELSKELAAKGAAVISGCALGVDSAAHRGALEAQGRTVAVLGTPLNVDYPAVNSGLKRNILSQKGLIISEYPIGTKVQRSLFPVRNRLLSGLSDGTVIVEAAKKSGSIHTAESAMEQGKELFCVPPADIFQKRYDGVKEYLRNGAHIVLSSQDVFDAFRFIQKPTMYSQMSLSQHMSEDENNENNTELSDKEKQICNALGRQNLTLNGIAEQTEIPAFQLVPLLTEMELSGLIRKNGSGSYEYQL